LTPSSSTWFAPALSLTRLL